MFVRSQHDRRRNSKKSGFPLTDGSGETVTRERRSTVDRRLAGIGSELNTPSSEEGLPSGKRPPV